MPGAHNRFKSEFKRVDEFRKFINPGKLFNTRKSKAAMRLKLLDLVRCHLNEHKTQEKNGDI